MKRRPRRITVEEDTGKVAAMYQAYEDGMSLAKIGELYRVSRQTIYDVFRYWP